MTFVLSTQQRNSSTNAKQEKLAPYGDWLSTLLNWRLWQLQSHVTQKLRRISKIWPDKNEILGPSLRIRGQLPAPIVNGRRDSCWKRPDFQLWRARDLNLDLGSGHTAYCRASFIDLPTCQISLKSKKLFVDGGMYVRIYIRTHGQMDIWDQLY